MNRTTKGNIAELKAIEHFYKQGYAVFKSVFDNAIIDLILLKDNNTKRVSVKYCSKQTPAGNFYVELRNVSRRANNAVNVKKFDKDTCDVLAVYVEQLDKIITVDSNDIKGKSGVTIMEDKLERI